MNAGGVAHDLTVSSGGTLQIVAGTITSNVTVLGGGNATLINGLMSGSSGAGTVLSGGTLTVFGGEADFVLISSGGFGRRLRRGGQHDRVERRLVAYRGWWHRSQPVGFQRRNA